MIGKEDERDQEGREGKRKGIFMPPTPGPSLIILK